MDVEPWLLAHEPPIRVAFFVGVFALVALWERAAPRRALTLSRRQRWSAHLGIVLLNTVTVRLVFPTAAAGMAALGVERGWGLLNHVDLPFWLAVALAVVAMDLAIWLQHVVVHAVPALWRLHRVHHADLDFDLTTGARFHPIEIVLSMGIKFATITLLGAPVLAVVVFEVLLSACAMFNHGNLRLPERVDRVLRWFLVTPDMHRVHHSVEVDESNSNFGFNLTWWDRLFGTYRAQPRAGQLGMGIGIHGHSDPREVARLGGMLLLPFRGRADARAIQRHGADPDRSAPAAGLLLAPAAPADNQAIAVDGMAAYLELVDYGGGVIFAGQIPKDAWPKMLVIDVRDAGQFARGHIPGAINLDWRQVLARRDTIPRDKPVLIYCDTGSLSAQAGFALRVAGWDQLRILQGGMEAWKARGGVDAAAKASAPARH